MKRILFVDDEPNVLQGLENSLFRYLDQWDMTFVDSGQAALSVMSQEPIDVIVTDVRMPGIDGAELLRLTHERFPNVIRIVLSGQTERKAAAALPVCFQFLSKPCSAATMRATLDRAGALLESLGDDRVRQSIMGVRGLPVQPHVRAQLNRVLADDNASLLDVGRIVEGDIALSARMLQVANTEFISDARRTSVVSVAVARLGWTIVRALVSPTEYSRELDSTVANLFSIEALNARASNVARMARALTEGELQKQEAFLAGLLCDVGTLAMVASLPEQYSRVLREEKKSELSLHEVERENLGTSHAEIGANLLSLWGFSETVVEAVANHHASVGVPEAPSQVATAVYLASLLADEQALARDEGQEAQSASRDGQAGAAGRHR